MEKMMGGANGKSGLRVWRNARLATMADGVAGLGIVEKGAIAARDGLIVYAGAEASMPAPKDERTSVADDMFSGMKSMFHAVLPK